MIYDLDDLGLFLADYPTPRVAVVGHVSRTWLIDYELVRRLLRSLALFAPHCIVVHAGAFPFDELLERFAPEFDLLTELVGPDERGARLQPYERDPCILSASQLVVGFPPLHEDPYSADPGIVLTAQDLGIPCINVGRCGAVGPAYYL